MRRIGKVRVRKRKMSKVIEMKRKSSESGVSELWGLCPNIEKF